ncbi:MAG: hypothetical protein MUC28_03515 [Planctomycetes bacterium]|jgi:hypothetical protein|nr:hypothetical protein [Planctomycetota bacterium]
MDKGKFVEFIGNEEKNWQEVLRIRQEVESNFVALRDSIAVKSRYQAVERGVAVCQQLLTELVEAGVDFSAADPAHAVGHLIRDYANAHLILDRLDCDPRDVFIGILAGTLHDVGCALVYRYEDVNRAVRHAEVEALHLNQIINGGKTGLSAPEQLVFVYSIMAHTHYTKPAGVLCTDGVKRTIQPYLEYYADGRPFLPVWLPRWVDRLDNNGPCHPPRHYLTLAEVHHDFDGDKFIVQKFEEQLVPKRKEVVGHPTMLSHLYMYANTQTNESVYGRNDHGWMVEVRNRYRAQVLNILAAVESPNETLADPSEQDHILQEWEEFVTHNIEPISTAVKVAADLSEKFRLLPADARTAWCTGFQRNFQEYKIWSQPILDLFESLPGSFLRMPGLAEDIRSIISY